jgi:hypothetical protein
MIYITNDAVCTVFLAQMVDVLWSLQTVDLVHIRDSFMQPFLKSRALFEKGDVNECINNHLNEQN